MRIYVAPQSRGCCSYFRRPQRPSGRRILFHSLKTSRHPFSLITLTLLHCYVFPKIQYYGNLSFILFVKSRKSTEHSFFATVVIKVHAFFFCSILVTWCMLLCANCVVSKNCALNRVPKPVTRKKRGIKKWK